MAEEDLLPPAAPPPRPAPWRAIGAAFVPAAALAAGVGLQRLFEGPLPSGDALLRWMLWSTGSGLLVGALVGLLLRSRALWAGYGVVAPWAVAGLIGGIAFAVRPLGEALADRREAECRASGRTVCTTPEFVAACAKSGAGLGEPQQKLCNQQGCTSRWVYVGPFRPDTYLAPGTLLCSVVADTAGKGVRYALLPADEPRN